MSSDSERLLRRAGPQRPRASEPCLDSASPRSRRSDPARGQEEALSDDDRLARLLALYEQLPESARVRFLVTVTVGPAPPRLVDALVHEVLQRLSPDHDAATGPTH